MEMERMEYDVALVSVWTEPVCVNPSYQLIRNEINRYSRILAAERLTEFMTSNPDRASEYGDVVRYQDQFPYCPGLLSIAAVLEEAGFNVLCVSLDVERERIGGEDWLEVYVRRLCSMVRIAVGVSAVTPEYHRAIQFLELVKRHAPALRTMIGGTHVTYIDDEPARNRAVDVVVRGEGESTALDLMQRWRDNRPIDDVPGTTIDNGGVIRRNPDRQLLDCAKLPVPAYHLLDAATLARVHLTPTYSSGCPFQCNYCVESIFWERRVRHKDPVRFVDELETIIRLTNWKFIHIADSTFGINREATELLCDELERRNLDAVFSVNVRPDVFSYMGEELVRRLARLRFVEFYIGMESADEGLLASLNRRQSHAGLLEALHKLKEIGIPFVKLYLIVGAPGDTHEGIQNTLNSIRRMLEQGLIYYATGKFFVPAPGTEQFERPSDNGYRFLTRDWSLYERYNFPPVVEHRDLSAFEIEQYVTLLQAMQLAIYRKRLGPDADEQRRIRAWTQRTYYRKIYL
jgi:anaerobic magnesium-protoporphyrin IX monomethyl ester cyclase